MTQLVCHEDRTLNRATLFPRSIEIARARTTVIYKPPAIRDKIKDENKKRLVAADMIVCDSDRRRETRFPMEPLETQRRRRLRRRRR